MDIDEPEAERPAIKALGSLFKLTEVSLWDDGTTETRRGERTKPAPGVNDTDDDNDGQNVLSTTSDCSTILEDFELTEQMNALGLPLSFRAKKKNGEIIGKRKPSRAHQNFEYEALEFPKVSVGITSPIFDDANNSSCMSLLGQNESSDCHVAVNMDKFRPSFSEECNSTSSTVITSATIQGRLCNEMLDLVGGDEVDCDSSISNTLSDDDVKHSLNSISLETRLSPENVVTDADVGSGKLEMTERVMEYESPDGLSMFNSKDEFHKIYDNITKQAFVPESIALHPEAINIYENGSVECYADSGEWVVHWDSFYERNYFYNNKTHESTWYPSPGFDYFAVSETDCKSNQASAAVTEMDVSPGVNATDLRCLLEAKLGEKPMNCDKLINHASDELPLDAELAGSSSASLEHSIESHNIEKHSDRDKITALVPSEVCSNNFQLIGTEETNDEDMFSLDKPYDFILQEGNHVCTDDDEAFQVSYTGRSSQDCKGAGFNDSSKHFGDGVSNTDKVVTEHDSAFRKRKKKKRRIRTNRNSRNGSEVQFQAMPEEYSASIAKYWCQRYLLFSRFDSGIKMDKEGWFSVTPEPIARHHASRCGSGMIIDCFTGVGGNAIQFAKRSKHVIAIDIDPQKILYAHHNAAIYGVDNQIEFLNGDFFLLAPRLKADTVFLSPPWGGPDYLKVDTYNIKMLKPHDGYFLLNTAKKIASRIVMFLPRNVDLNQLAELCLSLHPPWSLEVEKNFLNGKLKAITAYFTENSGAIGSKVR